jgi:lipopolysaccharide/colanic/teichoic acid biosynthesis glycosyltransferase
MTPNITAILIASQKWLQMERLAERYPAAMLPLMDRPFIQHVMETLVNRGCSRFEVVLSHLPEQLEALLGDGKRWGVDIRYHLVSRPERPYRPLKLLGDRAGGHPALLVHADRLVQADIIAAKPSSSEDGSVLYGYGDDTAPDGAPALKWSGWAWLTRQCLADIPEDSDEKRLRTYLEERPGSRIEAGERYKPLSVQSCADLIAAHRSVLAKKTSGLMMPGKEVEEAIWLGRNVSLHPTARLTPPLYIGENCRIARGVQIGPDAVVGSNCVLDEKSTLSRSVVFPGSYVGEALELSDAIVDKNCLVNVRVGTEITIHEDFILGSLAEKQLRRGWNRIVSQLAGIVLLLPALPVVACLALYLKLRRPGRVFATRPVVRLPADSDPTAWKSFALISFDTPQSDAQKDPAPDLKPNGTAGPSAGWRHFFFGFLPALVNIARGELRFVGVPPRSAQAIENLPRDWRALYLESKPGIVTETMIHFGPRASRDEMYSAEAVYSVSSGLKHDLRLLARYTGQVLGLMPRPGEQ